CSAELISGLVHRSVPPLPPRKGIVGDKRKPTRERACPPSQSTTGRRVQSHPPVVRLRRAGTGRWLTITTLRNREEAHGRTHVTGVLHHDERDQRLREHVRPLSRKARVRINTAVLPRRASSHPG